MIDILVLALMLLSILGCGLMAGVFFAFSNFVMRALARVRPGEGLTVMQEINRTVLNRWFLSAFVGTAATSFLLVIASLTRDHPGSGFLLAGGLLYLIGTFAVTAVYNVPLNNDLALVDRENPAAEGPWSHYLDRWTLWNHVRTIAAAAALVSLVLAFRSST